MMPESHSDNTSPAPTAPPGFDLMGGIVAERPYPSFTPIRSERPVFFDPRMNAWVVTTFADAVAVLRDHERFSSANLIANVRNDPPEVFAALEGATELFSAALINLDPPEHTRLRSALHKSLTPRRVAGLEPSIRAQAHRLIDQFQQDGQADLLESFATPLAMHLICSLIGMPEADHARLVPLCRDIEEFAFGYTSVERRVECARSMSRYHRYVSELIAQRSAEPQDDLASELIQAVTSENDHLTRIEVLTTLSAVVIGGFATTADALSNGLYWLLREPEHWRAIVENPALIPKAVDELLRFEGSTVSIYRRTAAPATLSGVEIPAGSMVLLLISSANHDERQFPDPEQIDLTRENAVRNLTFGYGIHHCVGAPLTRLEIATALDVLRERLPGLHLPNPEQVGFRLASVRGPLSLPLVW